MGNLTDYIPSGELIQDTTPQLGGALDCNGKTINVSGYRQQSTITGSGISSINYSTGGDVLRWDATGSLTISFNSFPSGQVAVAALIVKNWGNYTISWPGGTLFEGGTAPELTVAGEDRLTIFKDKDDVFTVSVAAADVS